MDRMRTGRQSGLRRAGLSHRILFFALPVLLVVPAIAWKLFPGLGRTSEGPDVMMSRVEKRDFANVVTERGNLESASNEEIRCKVQSLGTAGTRILKIVPEGTKIEDGGDYLNLDHVNLNESKKPTPLKYKKKNKEPIEPLVTLDSSSLENDHMKQESAYNTSLATLIQAQSAYETAMITFQEYFGEPLEDYVWKCEDFKGFWEEQFGRLSDDDFAAIYEECFGDRLAEEGKYYLDRNTIESEITVAKEQLGRLTEYEQYSRQLEAKGYITAVQLAADHFATQKAQMDLDSATNKLDVLQYYTKEKMAKQLKADIDSAKARWDAAKATNDLDKDKLDKIVEQIKNCTVLAEEEGQVVYASNTEQRGGQEIIIEEGAVVREHQVIIRLPDLKRMQVKAKVNEAKVALVREKMPATVRLDAFPELELKGEVEKVSEFPAAGSWWASNVKEYDTIVKIFNAPVVLRPGYTAEVSILAAYEPGVLQVPVQAVIEHGGKHYCAVRTESGWEPRLVKIGPSNDKFVVIREGLAETESVAQAATSLRTKLALPDVATQSPDQTLLAAVPPGGIPAVGAKPSPGADERPKRSDERAKGGEERAKGMGGKGGGPRSAGMGDPKEMADRMFERFDKDKDGKLQESELPEMMRSGFVALDTNKDKGIDKAEWAAGAAAMARQFGGKGKRPPQGPPGPPGGGP